MDTFILFDNVQYTRNDWRNSNTIETANGEHWLNIPVEHRGWQRISVFVVANRSFPEKHCMSIDRVYREDAGYNYFANRLCGICGHRRGLDRLSDKKYILSLKFEI
ncbi:WbqC family protein [Magnetospirillum fulvum]|uniref:WbqC family protein n=1 Tax=Magnetospirillum fulvum TaxID=1082 RepID=UPI003CC7AAA5